MIIQTKRWLVATKLAVANLQKNYASNRGLLLTEGDLECQLFSELLKQPGLNKVATALDCVDTTFVHSQMTWFKKNQKSGFEVDLTLCNPANMEANTVTIMVPEPNKGYAHDGPCVAIELKFIRDIGKASMVAHEDYLKLRDKLIPAKIANITNPNSLYHGSNLKNIAFISIVGCKDKTIFDKAMPYIGKHLADTTKTSYSFLHTCLFYQDKVEWDKQNFIQAYKNSNLFPKPVQPNLTNPFNRRLKK